MARIAIHLVTWNGAKYVPHCLRSVAEQDFRDFELVVVDNGSNDNTLEEIEKWAPKKINLSRIQRNTENHGFAGGHNEAMTLTTAPYVLMLNQDIILAPTFLTEVKTFLDSRPGVGSVGGKLMRWGFGTIDDRVPLGVADSLGRTPNGQASSSAIPSTQSSVEKLDIIDTVGLRIFSSHRVVELGQGEVDKGQYETTRPVFGISGACPVYRRTALEDVTHPTSYKLQATSSKEYFDQDFFSYKEDVDLAYRLAWRGWGAYYLPRVIAWHARSVGGSEDLSDPAAIRGRKSKRTIVTRWSYRNHLGFLVKNVSAKTWRRYGLQIGWYEFKKIVWIMTMEWRTLPSLIQFLRLLPRFLDKRTHIMHTRKVTDQQIWKWIP